MSVRTWHASNGERMAMLIMMVCWTILMLARIVQTRQYWNANAIAGLAILRGNLHMGVLYLHTKETGGKKKCRDGVIDKPR